MKSVTCFVEGQLRDETLAALVKFWGPYETCLHALAKGDAFGYGRVLCQHWSEGKSFAVIEPDIVITKQVAWDFHQCERTYCAFPYAWTTNIGPALGCTRFRSEFLLRYPEAMKKAFGSRVSWEQLDVVLMRHVLAREYGEQPHVHLPPVTHLNEAKALRPDGDPNPMMEVPCW